MANLVDLYLVYRILRRLTQPFTDWEAYKQGVIDAEGNILKKSDDRKTPDEKESFTKFDLLILKLKKLLGTVPFGKTKIASYIAALWFLKEEKRLTEDNLQEEFEKFCIKEKMLSEKLEDFYSKKNPPPMHHVIRNYYHLTDRGYKENEINNYFNKTFGMKLKKGDIEKHIAKNLHSFQEAKVDKHEMSGIIVIDGYVVNDSGREGRSTYGRYTVKDPNYKPDPKEKGMHRNYRRPSSLSFSTMAEVKKWIKTQPKKSAAEIEAIHKKYAEREKMYTEEAPANVASSGNVAGLTGDPPVGKKAQQKYTKRFANNDVFVVSSDTYNKARLGKRKFVKYETYVGNDEIGNAIREYGRKYPKKPIILQDGENGPMIFLRRGRNTFKEHLELTENVSQSDLKDVEKV